MYDTIRADPTGFEQMISRDDERSQLLSVGRVREYVFWRFFSDFKKHDFLRFLKWRIKKS